MSSTRRSRMPGVLEASEVDVFLTRPTSSRRGVRGSVPTFGGLEVPESEWPQDLADAASAVAKCCRTSLSSASVAKTDAGEVLFVFDVVPGADLERTLRAASNVARSHGVSATLQQDKLVLASREAMGRLFRAEPYGKPQAAGIADAGVVIPRTGSSGFRGGRDPFSTAIGGPEIDPSSYSRFGADEPMRPWSHGRVKTPVVEYDGPAALFVAMGGIYLLARAMNSRG